MFPKKTVFRAVTATTLLLTGILFNANAQTGMGVGTNTPAEKLDVNGAVKIGNTSTTNAGTIRWTGTDFEGYDGSQWIQFGGGASGWSITGNSGTTPGTNFIGTTDYQDLRIRTNNFDRLTITREGNVGIATTNATGRFQTKLNNGEFSLWDNGGFLGTSLLGGFTGNAGFAPQMRFAETGVGPYWDLGMNDSSYFAIEASDVARFVVQPGGNVGIGTTVPVNKLEVVGSDMTLRQPNNFAGAIFSLRGNRHNGVSGNPWNNPTTGYAAIDFKNYDASDGNIEYIGARIVSVNEGASDDGDLRFFTTSDQVYGETMRLDYTGNVGIGAVPTERLHVAGSIRMVDGNQQVGYVPVSDANGIMTWTDPSTLSDGDWTISGNNQYSALSGNVGVGTNAPATKLDVYNGDLQVGRTGNTSGSFIAIRGGKNGGGVPYNGAIANALGRLEFRNTDVLSSNTEYTSAAITSENRPGSDDGDLRFYTTSDLVTTEAMNIDYTGNVGIGTIAADKLHVMGNIRMVDGNQQAGYIPVSDANGKMTWTDPAAINDGDWTISGNNQYSALSGNVGVGTNVPATKLDVYNGDLQVGRTGNTSSSFITIRGGKNGGGVPYNDALTSGMGRLEFHNTDIGSSNTEYVSGAIVSTNRPGTDDGDLRFYTTSDLVTTEAMNIDYAGNVGIGTIAADKLHVIGNIRMVDGNQAAGYVPVSDANGKMTWTDPGTIAGDTLSIIADADRDTKVQVEKNNDEDRIRFDIGGTEYFRMDQGRLVVSNFNSSIAIGGSTLPVSTGINNIAIGDRSLNDNTSGDDNIAIGELALEKNTTGRFNVAIGTYSMTVTTGASNNVAIGKNAGYQFSGGDNNTFIGMGAGRGSSGANNTAIGQDAGRNASGSGGVFIGRNAGVSVSDDNRLYIDNSGTTTPLIWGDFAADKLGFFGNVGIGTSTANNNLDVKGKVAIGSNYAGASAPGNGLIVEGLVGIGTSNPNRLLTVGTNLTTNLGPKATINTDGNQPLLVGENTNNKGVMIGYDGNDIQGRTGTSLSINGDLLLNRYGGNIGVGTTTPGQKLDVNGKIQMRTGAVAGYIPVADANGTMTWTNPTTITTGDDGDWTVSGSNLYSTPSGSIGIGTSSPVNKLHVEGTTHMTDDLTINVASTSGKGITFRDGYEGRYHVGLNVYDHSGGGTGFADGMAVSGYDGLSFITGNTSSTYGNVRMLINLAGNVGIGTTIPGQALDVNGKIQMRTGATAGYIPVSDANGTMTWTDPATLSTSANTLDQAYDAGGAGAGRIINVTDGPVHLRSGGPNVGSGGLMIGGNNLSNTGFNSMVLGDGSSISGNNSFSGGFFSSVTSNNSIGFGRGVSVTGAYSTSFGISNTSSGAASFTANEANNASGNYSAALGLRDTASGGASMAFGVDNYARSFGELTAGVWATDYTPANANGFNASDRVFTVGNGTASGSRSNAMVILKSGNTGIGATTPSALFHTYKPTLGETGGWRMAQGGSTSVIYHNGNNDLVFRKLNQTDQLVLDTDGNVGIGTESPGAKLDVDGQIQMRTGATAGYIPVSDANGTMTWTDPTTLTTADDGDWITSGSNIYNGNSGFVGIGTTAPKRNLHISGGNASLITNNSSYGDALILTSTQPRIYFEDVNRPTGQRVMDIRFFGGVMTVGSLNDNATAFTQNATLSVTNAGNVGVSTDTPTQKLDVNGQIRMRTGATAGYIPVSDANGTMTWTDPTTVTTANDGDWTVSGVNQYSTPTGNVGIGTTSPSNKLHVEGSATINTNGVSGRGLTLRAGYNDRYHLGLHAYDHSSGGTGFADGLTVSGYDGISFITEKIDNVYGNVRMLISQAGNVGIGTTTPTQKLHVDGSIYTTDNYELFNTSGTGNASAPRFRIDGFSDKLYIIAESNANGPVGGTEIMFRTASSNTIAADRVVIDKNGNVGIASLSPSSVLSIYEPDESTTQTNFTQAVGNGGVLITTDYTDGAYTPGLFWSTSNNNSAKPKAGIYLQETNTGTRMLFGTSNNYVTGITNTALTINEVGSVGIGTPTPAGVLHIVTANVNNTVKLHNPTMANGTLMGFEFGKSNSADNMVEFRYNHVSDGSGSNFVNLGLWGGANTFVVTGNDAVGIGTTNPTRAKLEVIGSRSTSLGYGYLNSSGNTGTSSGTVPYSIYASDRIACSEFNAFSDERIKNIKGVSDSKEDLATLMGIEITNYTLKDNLQKGDKEYKKVIAQQVEKVYPQVVSTVTDVIPDIYQLASISEGRVALPNNFVAGDRVKLIFENREETVEVLSSDTKSFTVRLEDEGQVFVYGREVNDFHTVDYEALSTLNISATQELVKQLESLKLENEALKTKLTTQEAINHANTKRFEAIETQLGIKLSATE